MSVAACANFVLQAGLKGLMFASRDGKGKVAGLLDRGGPLGLDYRETSWDDCARSHA